MARRTSASDENDRLNGGNGPIPAEVSQDSVRAELDKVLASRAFSHAGRSSRLLRFAVEHAVKGRGDELNEHLLGVKVLDKAEDFDPRIDPAVRVEAHRLRSKLKTYYESEGADDRVRIELPKGGYTPVFRAAPPAGVRQPWRSPKALVAMVLPALILLAAYGIARLRDGVGHGPAGSAIPAAEHPSVAVLPFADLSHDRDQEYFCDGITDELINALAKVEGLRVVSRTSSFQFKGKATDIRRVAQQLNVTAVLEGSVRRSDGRLRITAQLVKAADGFQIWSGTFDREAREVFAIQDEISSAIGDALRVRLVDQRGGLLAKAPATLEAYHLYLRGRFLWNKRTADGMKRSIALFEEALALEPGWAAAHAAIADSYALLASYGVLPPNQVMPAARTAAGRALELDSSLAEAHAALGFVRSFYDWDWPSAEREYKHSIRLKPGYATAHHWYSGFLRAMGRFDEALAASRRAQELDPLSVAIGKDVGRVFYSRQQYDRAIEQYGRVLELEPNFPSGYFHLGMAYEGKGMYREALQAFHQAAGMPGANPLFIGALGHGHAIGGNRREAHRLLARLDEVSRKRYVSPMSRAIIHIGLGEKDRAFEWLGKACEEHDPWLAYLKVEPIFDTLRSDPRFPSLLKRGSQQAFVKTIKYR